MAPSSSGAIVLVQFPFSNLAQSKLRPALVMAASHVNDWILCQITSNPYADPLAIEILKSDFAVGSLHRTSYARPDKLFTASEQIFTAEVGKLSKTKFVSIANAVKRIIDDGIVLYR